MRMWGALALLLWSACAHVAMPPMRGGTEIGTLIEAPREDEAWEPSRLYPVVGGVVEERGSARRVASAAETGPLVATAWLWFRVYQTTLSRVDGSTCRFRPTCSGFGLGALQQAGVAGVPMAFGRLHRSHAAEAHYPMSEPPYLDDPVANYTFTRRRPRLDDFAAYEDEAHAWYQHVRATRRLR